MAIGKKTPSNSLASTRVSGTRLFANRSCNPFCSSPTSAIGADVNVTWDCDDLGSYIYTAAENHLDPQNSVKVTNAVARQIIVSPRKSPFSRYHWKGSCAPGQLTPLGAQQHRTLGGILREIYVHRWKFLPAEFDPSTLYVRSTGKKEKHCGTNLTFA
jgi:hypothetical protein